MLAAVRQRPPSPQKPRIHQASQSVGVRGSVPLSGLVVGYLLGYLQFDSGVLVWTQRLPVRTHASSADSNRHRRAQRMPRTSPPFEFRHFANEGNGPVLAGKAPDFCSPLPL